MYYIYVLRSEKDRKFYIGYTDNLRRRFSEHQKGRAKATRTRLPLVLFFYEAYLAKSDAKRRERYFKTSKGKSSPRMMLQDSLRYEKK